MSDPVVTISAPFGTGGAVIGRAVSEELGVEFLDRAIPTSVARALAVPLEDVLAHDERAETRVGRLLEAMAVSGLPDFPRPWDLGRVPTESAYREETERVINEAAQSGGCVILGRGAVMVLRDHPTALHVCLGGSLERRVGQVVLLGQDDETDARRLVEDSDRTRSAYFRHFYRVEPNDVRLYHLVVDSTLLDVKTCTDLIVAATRARGRSDGA